MPLVANGLYIGTTEHAIPYNDYIYSTAPADAILSTDLVDRELSTYNYNRVWLNQSNGKLQVPPQRWVDITGKPSMAGGTTGQILAKKSNTSYDTHWIDPPSAGGNLKLAVDTHPIDSININGSLAISDFFANGKGGQIYITFDLSQMDSLSMYDMFAIMISDIQLFDNSWLPICASLISSGGAPLIEDNQLGVNVNMYGYKNLSYSTYGSLQLSACHARCLATGFYLYTPQS